MTLQVLPLPPSELGESPFWHPEESTLYWVDIAGRQLLRANTFMGEVQRWDMPAEPGCIAPFAGGGLVIALRTGIFRARSWGGALEHLATLPYDTATVRANDGKCDPQGRLWVTTVDETKACDAAALYSVDCRSGSAQVQCHARGALTGNGLAWSPDGATLYWADTPRHTVYAFSHAGATNVLGDRSDFVRVAPKPDGWHWSDRRYQGRPDGAAVDQHGHYTAAMYEGRVLCRFAADGSLQQEMELPAQCPTMPCFGGDDLRTLYVTSARKGRPADELDLLPDSGSVFYRQVPTPGLPVQFFRTAD